MALGLFNKPVYDEVASTAKAFGDAMVKLGAKYKNVVVLDANAGRFLNLGSFARTFPDRYFNFGNAESNMIGAAAGFTVRGKIPFLCSFSMFITGRAWEQIRNAVAYPMLNVKFVGAFSGVLCGEDGATYQALEDVALMRAIPNMKIASPVDGVQTKQVLEAMMNDFGPTYLPRFDDIGTIRRQTSYFSCGIFMVPELGRFTGVFFVKWTTTLWMQRYPFDGSYRDDRRLPNLSILFSKRGSTLFMPVFAGFGDAERDGVSPGWICEVWPP
ncbi:MAG: hypothetical protein U0519_04810 [Candidatus Gracilibacteria bacterium]